MNEYIKDLKALTNGSPWGLNDRLQSYITKLEKEAKEVKNDKSKRTDTQNKSLHLYFSLVAKALNEAGWSVQKVLEKKSRVDIDWDGEKFKNIIWRPIQEAVLKKKSTTDLRKQEDIDKVYDHVNRFLTDPREPVLDEPIPFPSEEHKSYLHEAQKLTQELDYEENTLEEPVF